VIVTESASGYVETSARLIGAITRRGLTVFARIDHAAAARSAGLDLPPEEVVIFGNPQAGTPLMRRDPKVGYELPLRILLWQVGDRALLGYRDPKELADEYDLSEEGSILDRMATLLAEVVAEASS
jgi:uncharacterized protein (DUF302 family)